MSATFDCYRCFAVYFSNFPGPHVCEVCGEALRERPDGAEPFADVETGEEMSLDVYLNLTGYVSAADEPYIPIREAGRTRKISREEWDQLYPGRQPVIVKPMRDEDSGLVFDYNITHNLADMAREAGIYYYLWRPDEIGVTQAKQLIEPLTAGLARLEANPDRYKQFNPENGWGTYEGLVEFVRSYLTACMDYPDAMVSVCR